MHELEKLRNSNIELRRIIAIFLLLWDISTDLVGVNHFSLLSNSILIIIYGAWFMVDAKFSGKRIIST